MRTYKHFSRRSTASLFNLRARHLRRFALATTLMVALLVWSGAVKATCNFLLKWGTTGTGEGQFTSPRGIAVDSAGNVYVPDQGAPPRVQKFGANGNFILQFGLAGDVPGGFVTPARVAADPTGSFVYVTDSFTNRVSKFTTGGTFVSTFSGAFQSGIGPAGIVVDSAGDIYVADPGNNRVLKFNSAGSQIATIGSAGSGNGQFSSAFGVAVDSADNLYVADTNNNRIQKFNSSGTFLTKWGTLGTNNGEFTGPQGVAVDSVGNVYVADTGNNRIQTFSSSGTFLDACGSAGSGDGEFSIPADVAVNSAGTAYYVVETGNERVQKFGIGAAPPVADAGPDQTVECTGATTSVTLDGTSSTGSGTLSYAWSEGATPLGTGATLSVALPSGAHTITLTVMNSGGSATDTVAINIVDTMPPVITLNGANPLTVECHTTFTDPGATATDGCAGSVAVSASGTVDANTPATYTITYTATDGANPATATRTVNVVDHTGPTITPNGQAIALWPPNHKFHMVNVSDLIASADDACDGGVGLGSVLIAQVSSDEGTAADGDIHIAPGCKSVQLRAERDGNGNGRVYTITFRVRDAGGNETTVTRQVIVPHDQGNSGAVDDGPAYTVVSSCP
jgi:DNA-binding beta-propeller fold protein YncE